MRLVALRRLLVVLAASSLGWPQSAAAQSWQVRAELGGIRLTAQCEGAVGFGAGVARRIGRRMALDATVVHVPENPAGNFGHTLAFAGITVGRTSDRYGVLAKVRPGVVRLAGDFFTSRNGGTRAIPAIDLGVVFDRYAGSGMVLRLQVGDAIMGFAGRVIDSGFGPAIANTTHNVHASVGVGVRF